MFSVNPNASAFFIETDPRFTNYRSWLSSAWMINALGIDPSGIHKRLGDGYYEQKLIRDQIAKLTGRRFLDGYANDEEQYKALMSAGVTFAKDYGLRPGIALTAEQMARLTSDIVWLVEEDVTLPDGTKVKALVPKVYVAVRNGDINQNGALLAADRIHLNLSGDATNTGDIAGRKVVTINADTISNLRGANISANTVILDAQKDIRNIGATITASDKISLNALGNIDIRSTTASQSGSGPYSWSQTTIDRTAGLYVTSPNGLGIIAMNAGKDIHLIGATIRNAGSNGITQINAGGSVNLGTVDTASSQRYEWNKDNFRANAQTSQVGTTIATANHVQINAGTDINATAATLSSDHGQIALNAGNNINLLEGRNTTDVSGSQTSQKSGLLSTTKTKTTWDSHSDTANGTTVSGDSVVINAGNDLTTRGANVVATNDVLLKAGNNIDIGAAKNTSHSFESTQTKSSGIFSDGGTGFTVGSKKQSSTVTTDAVTNTGSTIGSTDGAVTIVAGKDVTITGSDILSSTATAISGQNVTVQGATDTLEVTQTSKTSSSGLHVSLRGGAADVANSLIGSAQGAAQANDPRLKALYAAQAAQTLLSNDKAGLNSLKEAAKGNTLDENGNGMSLRVGIGASSSSSTTTHNESTNVASNIQSNGDVTITARGDANGHGGDLTVQGSNVAANNVTLAANRDLVLKSATDTSSDTSKNTAKSGEIGFTMGSEAGYGIYVSASGAKGSGTGSSTTHQETQINAANTVTLSSGSDTTLEGAQVRGDTVLANIGNNMTVTSQQDTDQYKRKDTSAGIDAVAGSGGWNVSANANQSRINSDYTSVNEQSGIAAGSGGFNVNVGNHTQLNGGAIVSTADASRNTLSTQTLTSTDLSNQASFNASSVGFSVSGGSNGGGFSPNIGVPQNEKESSTTKSAISNATVKIHSGNDAALAGINRDQTDLQMQGLANTFDEQKIREAQEMGQLAGQVGMTAAKDLIVWQQNRIAEEAKSAQKAMSDAKSQEEFDAAKRRLDQLKINAERWGENGLYKVTVQALAGALSTVSGGGDAIGAIGGVLMSESLLSRFSQYLQGKGLAEDGGGHDSIMSLMGVVLGIAGGAIGGDWGSGAASGNVAQQYGFYDYRDGRALRQSQIKEVLAQHEISDSNTVQGINTLVDAAIQLGAKPSDISLILQSPDAIEVLTVLAKPNSKSIETFGKPFNVLNQEQQSQVIAMLVGKVSVGNVRDLTSSAEGAQGDPMPPGGMDTPQAQIGRVLSNLIIKGGEKTEQVVNWFGKDTAEAAAILTMAAIGGPVKYGVSYVWNQTPIAKGIEELKESYLIKPGARVVGEYGFGATTPADHKSVYPASHAVSSMLVEATLSVFGVQNARNSAKSIVGEAEGIGQKVQAADAVAKTVPVKVEERVLVIPREKASNLDAYAAAADKGTLIRTDPRTVRTSGFRKKVTEEKGEPPAPNYHADHTVELCVGGANCPKTNSQWLPASQNTKAGSKLWQRIKKDPVGTKYTKVKVED